MGFLVMYISIDFYSLLVSGVIIGFGNGLSTGLIMALGGDYAPKDKRRGPFLSLFKLIYGSGQLFGPSMTGIASEYFGVQGGALLALIACVLGVFWAVIYIVDKESEVVQDDSHSCACKIGFSIIIVRRMFKANICGIYRKQLNVFFVSVPPWILISVFTNLR